MAASGIAGNRRVEVAGVEEFQSDILLRGFTIHDFKKPPRCDLLGAFQVVSRGFSLRSQVPANESPKGIES